MFVFVIQIEIKNKYRKANKRSWEKHFDIIKEIYLNTSKAHTPHVVMGINTKNKSFLNWKENSIIIKDFSFCTTNDKINLCNYKKMCIW